MTAARGAGPGGKTGRAGREAAKVKAGETFRGPAPPVGGVWCVPTFAVGQYLIRMRWNVYSLVLGLVLSPP